MQAGAEILLDEPLARRGREMLEALAAARPAGAVVSETYTGSRRLVVMYGVGLARRLEVRRCHLALGGRVAMWDLGYWARESEMRLAIDSLHPSAAQLAAGPPPGARDRYWPPGLREDANPAGPVLLIGLGRKSAAMYGLAPQEWERAKLAELRARFPGRTILWRPKERLFTPLPGALPRHGMTIDQAMRGCSLVVCRHSNVAIDACIAGVPAECDDGAARALYGGGHVPGREERADFLRRLAWWNWGPAEARGAWGWMLRMTE